MKKTIALLLTGVALSANAQYKSRVWSPDNGDGTYTNPVINADYSDPDVCVGASGEDYYMTASSFQCTPGLPILHSKDLVNWEIVGYALKELYTGDKEKVEHFMKPRHGEGVWAPSIRYHNGEYYIYWGDPDYGVYMVKTKDPAGEWENPVCVIEGKGMIDTTPLWDEDGRCYLVNGWANSRGKFASVLCVRELNKEGTKAISNPVIVFDGNGTENRTCEGPKFYKRDGWYWIMCPAGGVPTGFQLAMRSKSPYGPYEHKIVLAQGKTNINGPHQGAWVHTKYGEDWFLHFQDKEAYGRVVHLNPVDWSTGWPIMGKKGEPVTTYKKPKSSSSVVVNPVESDEFNTPVLGKQWQWHANYHQFYGMPTAFGTMRIHTHKLSEHWKNLWEVPNLLLQKTPGDEFTVTAKVRFTSKADGQFGGIIMMGHNYQALVVKRVGKEFQLLILTCEDADRGKVQKEELVTTLKPTAEDKIDYKPGIHEDIYLQLKVRNEEAGQAGGGKPKVSFAWSQNGKKFNDCGSAYQMKEGKWIGAKFGFVAAETNPKVDKGWLEADWIRVTK
ncbi:Beta-xylosidase [Prevotella sp. tc2-28]|uniref:glycoside hydrolase family 43 protein n=1 Tax=Prevotella sp. tc2-28 TaxID=1761888 RepID=UPI00089982B2|nr:glycoside hydrolase 43 family protein [Prevotella sp. tc2-28]SEA21364.1 Beta-xylosidase [Prevotella sp. tc2-28]